MEAYLDPEFLTGMATQWGTAIVLALVIFIVGRWVVTRVCNLLTKVAQKQDMDETLTNFLVSLVRWVGLLFVVIAALSQLGVDTTSLVALLGAAGLAVGLSLQSSLANFAAGVMIIIFKPFQKGDFIDAGGAMGSVDKITIFTTVLTTPDNKEIIVPNAGVIGGNITNFSARDTRRVDMVFGIGYGDDIKKAKALLEEIINADERVLKDPAPVVALGELADSSVNFLVRPWVNASDYWGVLWDTTETVKERFDAEGISIPFPQMDVHLQKSE